MIGIINDSLKTGSVVKSADSKLLGLSLMWCEPRLGHKWERQVLLMESQVVFLQILHFCPPTMNNQPDISEIFLKVPLKTQIKGKKKKELLSWETWTSNAWSIHLQSMINGWLLCHFCRTLVFFLFLLTKQTWINKLLHDLFITLLLGSSTATVLAKQPCYIQTKMYRLYRKMTIYSHFSI